MYQYAVTVGNEIGLGKGSEYSKIMSPAMNEARLFLVGYVLSRTSSIYIGRNYTLTNWFAAHKTTIVSAPG
jgi:hypothetical protein